MNQNGSGNINIAGSDKNSTEVKKTAFVEKIGNSTVLTITLPIFTCSEANGGAKKAIKLSNGKTIYKAEHWTEKYRRHRLQKGSVALMLRPYKEHVSLPCKITLTRCAPRKLDKFDNLPMSMKYILDSICEIITGDNIPGRADSYEGIDVAYDQEISKEYYVKISIRNLGEENGKLV